MNPAAASGLELLRDHWLAQWPAALAAWSRFTQLRPPTVCLTDREARSHGLTGSFAMIRLVDQSVIVSLPGAIACGVQDYPLEVLAHEIGHHVLAPATLMEHGRLLARIRRALPTLEHLAPTVSNIYTDLLINDRLQRHASLPIAQIYRQLNASKTPRGAVWRLYMRIYERLWQLPRGTLAGECDDATDGDAWLGARLIRSYARDWLDGGGRFAALLLAYLVADKESEHILTKVADTRHAAAGGDLTGLTSANDDDPAQIQHPALDPRLNGSDDSIPPAARPPDIVPKEAPAPRAQSQARQPFEYGEILRAAGIDITDHDAAVRYYREQALPHLVPFPSILRPRGVDPLPEGLEPWQMGDPLDTIDWLQSVIGSPTVIPGLTTVRRVWGESEASRPKPTPLDLDLYVDSSGSMANPQQQISYPALAGAIICLSALRSGARVQATLWSGVRQFTSTPGFVRDEAAILRVLTGYFGGATAFPIHILRDTFARRSPAAPPAHILIISDDGVTTLFDGDEWGNSGRSVSRKALAQARGGGTMVLNLPATWEESDHEVFHDIRRARDEHGWNVHRVADWPDLIKFARDFSKLRYGQDASPPREPSATTP